MKPPATTSARTRKPLRGVYDKRGGVPRVVIVRDVANASIPATRLRDLLTRVMLGEGHVGTVLVNVVNDTTMRRLNRQFRSKDKATDVLSFPLDGPTPDPSTPSVIGEIYCSYSHCKRWAKDNGGTIADEMLRLAVHGCLHLLGYDHHKQADHRRMLRAENQYLNEGGLIRARVAAEAGRAHA